ncbi:iron dicitrate transporter FecR [Parapedobacter pyrenivorans]|uniref:Iron dicitrate transporter FecR n=1 Tax=Parapedobacter pyrenivorans TaxID=1305674 RepID=A0A917HR58_9SPHI|nr:FecR family protein [Parapedobacter pyrenivorans]GGG86874.1 iron dicitrate transporter FecR [Parapedobacter pyrenivorans]
MNDRFSKEYIEALAHKYRLGTLTPAEEADFESWYNNHSDDTFIHSDAENPDRAMRRMHRHIRRNTASTTIRRLRRWMPYAAAVLLVVTAASWLFFSDQFSQQMPAEKLVNAEDVAPGANRATLTLADGRTINLSSGHAGIVIADGITYLDGSAVLSESLSKGVGEELTSSQTHKLTLTTPKGGTYSITLPDGSQVWLNANSTLKYPSQFTGDVREVILEGEAFFAVSHQSSTTGKGPTADRGGLPARRLPFKVQTAGQTVEVLGTQFNVSAYTDDPETKTTLIEGKVKISNLKSHASNLLSPGQQATTRGAATQIRKVDTEPHTAWKEGLFYFDNIPSRKAIEQVARWYDLDVIYDGNTPETIVFGMIDRDKPLSAVLNALAKNGLKFEVTSSGERKELQVSGNR